MPLLTLSSWPFKQECKESNPAGRFWRPLASQKHTPVIKGIRWELNPYLLLHRQTCLPRTPRTPHVNDESRMSNDEIGGGQHRSIRHSDFVILSSLGLSSFVISKQLDQDSNPELLVRSET